MSPTPDEEEDVRLFRDAVRDVKPLPGEDPPAAQRRHPEPVARFSRADRHAVLLESLTSERPAAAPPTLPGYQLRKLGDNK